MAIESYATSSVDLTWSAGHFFIKYPPFAGHFFIKYHPFAIHPSRNCHGWRHIGHSCREFCCDSNHFMTHCICSACPHRPQTGGESSPGNLTPGAAASNGIRQIPHTSSSISHFHTATQCHRLTLILTIFLMAVIIVIIFRNSCFSDFFLGNNSFVEITINLRYLSCVYRTSTKIQWEW